MASRLLLTKLAPSVRVTSIARRVFTTSIRRLDDQHSKISAKEVPVSAYTSDPAMNSGETHVLTVDQKSMPITTPIMDVAKKAFALSKCVAKNMTPTLKKFTLHGKVAIVTGYVHLV